MDQASQDFRAGRQRAVSSGSNSQASSSARAGLSYDAVVEAYERDRVRLIEQEDAEAALENAFNLPAHFDLIERMWFAFVNMTWRVGVGLGYG